MVVQRSWKIQSDASSTSTATTEVPKPMGGNSSSEDSNGSNQTTHSIATSITTSSHKANNQETTMTPSSNDCMKFVTTPQMAENMLLRLRQRLCPPVANSDAVMHTLDLLRSNLQATFDKEIDAIVRRFIDTFFKPAVKNIKENMGENSISDAMLKKIVCMMLEESKMQYTTFPVKTNFAQMSAKSAETSAAARMAIKRPAPKTTNPADIVKKANNLQTQQLNGAAAAAKTTVESTETSVRKLTVVAQPRRQIFWNTADISTSTNFVLDVQANQAFGFGTDGKERLASKHPELIRYLPDGEDRDWLISQNIISQQNRNSRFLFLIHDEVFKLYQNNDLYKKKPNITLSVMHTFKVPEFMIQKMKVFFVDLNIKSRGLITNSFCAATAQSNSHLRNALLQGAAQTSTSTLLATEPCCSSVGTSSAVNSVSTSTEAAATNSLNQSKPKPSTLSSSHATLTALLNNPNSNVSGAMIKTTNVSGRSNQPTTITYTVEKVLKK